MELVNENVNINVDNIIDDRLLIYGSLEGYILV